MGVVLRRKAESCTPALLQTKLQDRARSRRAAAISIQRKAVPVVHGAAAHNALFSRLREREKAVGSTSARVAAALATDDDAAGDALSRSYGAPGAAPSYPRWQVIQEYLPPLHDLRYVVRFHRAVGRGQSDLRAAPVTTVTDAYRFSAVYKYGDGLGPRSKEFPTMTLSTERTLEALTRGVAEHLERSQGMFCLELALEFICVGARASSVGSLVCTAALGARWIQCDPLWTMVGRPLGASGDSNGCEERDKAVGDGAATARHLHRRTPTRASPTGTTDTMPVRVRTPSPPRAARHAGSERGSRGTEAARGALGSRRPRPSSAGVARGAARREYVPPAMRAAAAQRPASARPRPTSAASTRGSTGGRSARHSWVDGGGEDGLVVVDAAGSDDEFEGLVDYVEPPGDSDPLPHALRAAELTSADVIANAEMHLKSARAKTGNGGEARASSPATRLETMSLGRPCRTLHDVGIAGQYRRMLAQLRGCQEALMKLLDVHKREERRNVETKRANTELQHRLEELQRNLKAIDRVHKEALQEPTRRLEVVSTALGKERARRQQAEQRVTELKSEVRALESEVESVRSTLDKVKKYFGVKLSPSEDGDELDAELSGTNDKGVDKTSEQRVHDMNVQLQVQLREKEQELAEARGFRTMLYRVLADVNHAGVDKPRRLAGGFSSMPRPTEGNVSMVVSALINDDWAAVAKSAASVKAVDEAGLGGGGTAIAGLPRPLRRTTARRSSRSSRSSRRTSRSSARSDAAGSTPR